MIDRVPSVLLRPDFILLKSDNNQGVVVSEIIRALNRLNEALEALEQAAAEQEMRTRKSKQHDLFGLGRASAAKQGKSIDADLFAKRLDVAIEKVEHILREG